MSKNTDDKVKEELAKLDIIRDKLEDIKELYNDVRHLMRKSKLFYSATDVEQLLRSRLAKKIEKIEELEMKILDLQE